MKFGLGQLRALLSRRRLEAEMVEEMHLHVELQAELNRRTGMSPTDAHHAALREFGNVAVLQERVRQVRGWTWLEQLAQDLRYAARSWRRQPGFTLSVILILALGIGASTAVFALVDSLLFRSLPVPDADRVVRLVATGPQRGDLEYPYPLFHQSDPDFPVFPYPYAANLVREGSGLCDLAVVSGWYTQRAVRVAGDSGLAESAYVEEVSGNYFRSLGIKPVLGRTMAPEDDLPGHAAPVAVISHSFWLRRFGADPKVLGRTLAIDNVLLTIIGVADRSFTGFQVGGNVAAWVPIQLSPQIDGNAPWETGALQSTSTPWVHLVGRLKPGVTPERAAAALDLAYQNKLAELSPRRRTLDPTQLLVQHIELRPAGSGYGGLRPRYAQSTQVLLGMVVVMQLLACINVAGLLLARSAARQREMAVRLALGASRGRLTRQVLAECSVLGAGGGLLGLIVAEVGFALANRFFAGGIEVAYTPSSLGFALGLTAFTTLVLGSIPALIFGRRGLSYLVRAHGGARPSRLGAVLVTAQVGLALVMLVVAGLLTRTVQNLDHTDLGFARRERLLADLNLPPRYDEKARLSFYQRARDAVQRLPGVVHATIYQGIGLLGENTYVHSFTLVGGANRAEEQGNAEMALVSNDFFSVMNIPIIRGRALDSRDDVAASGRAPALVISEWSAREIFGEADPVGRRIKLDEEYEVVGVARDVKFGSVRDPSRHVFYAAMAQRPNTFRATLAVQFSGALTGLALTIESRLRQEEAQVQLSAIRTIEERLAQTNQRENLLFQLSVGFGLFALVLAAIGLFGLLAYTVSQRTREIGIRLALGATRESVLGLVARQGLGLVGLGVGLGVIAGAAVTRFLGALLFGVGPGDVLVYGLAAGTLLAAGAVACWLPARRAAKVDPTIALRAE